MNRHAPPLARRVRRNDPQQPELAEAATSPPEAATAPTGPATTIEPAPDSTYPTRPPVPSLDDPRIDAFKALLLALDSGDAEALESARYRLKCLGLAFQACR